MTDEKQDSFDAPGAASAIEELEERPDKAGADEARGTREPPEAAQAEAEEYDAPARPAAAHSAAAQEQQGRWKRRVRQLAVSGMIAVIAGGGFFSYKFMTGKKPDPQSAREAAPAETEEEEKSAGADPGMATLEAIVRGESGSETLPEQATFDPAASVPEAVPPPGFQKDRHPGPPAPAAAAPKVSLPAMRVDQMAARLEAIDARLRAMEQAAPAEVARNADLARRLEALEAVEKDTAGRNIAAARGIAANKSGVRRLEARLKKLEASVAPPKTAAQPPFVLESIDVWANQLNAVLLIIPARAGVKPRRAFVAEGETAAGWKLTDLTARYARFRNMRTGGPAVLFADSAPGREKGVH